VSRIGAGEAFPDVFPVFHVRSTGRARRTRAVSTLFPLFPVFLVLNNMGRIGHCVNKDQRRQSGTLGTQGIRWAKTGNTLGTAGATGRLCARDPAGHASFACELPKVEVEGSNPVSGPVKSTAYRPLADFTTGNFTEVAADKPVPL
jgi:hypothetical protein